MQGDQQNERFFLMSWSSEATRVTSVSLKACLSCLHGKKRSKNADAFWEGLLNGQRRKGNLALKIMATQGDSWRDSLVVLMGTGAESKRQIPPGAKHASC